MIIRNSMTDHITPDAIANDARLKRQHRENRVRAPVTIIIVEGTSDKRLYVLIADHPNCIIVHAYGKSKAIKACQILKGNKAIENNTDGVVVFIDDDFDSLSGKTISNENIIVSDMHDLETMLLSSPALKTYLSLLLPQEKLIFLDDFYKYMQKIIVKMAMPVGCARWVSYERGCHWSFKDLDLKEFIELETRELNIKRLSLEIKTRNNFGACVDLDLENKIEEKLNQKHDPWQVCCGHDLMKLLMYLLRIVIPKEFTDKADPDVSLYIDLALQEKARNPRLITEWLIACYSGTEYFRNTNMYKKLVDWEKKNNPYKVFATQP